MQFQPDLNKSICSTPAPPQLSAIKGLQKKKKKSVLPPSLYQFLTQSLQYQN